MIFVKKMFSEEKKEAHIYMECGMPEQDVLKNIQRPHHLSYNSN